MFSWKILIHFQINYTYLLDNEIFSRNTQIWSDIKDFGIYESKKLYTYLKALSRFSRIILNLCQIFYILLNLCTISYFIYK